jgi:hypothetical protein
MAVWQGARVADPRSTYKGAPQFIVFEAPVPFKANADRRHKIPTGKYRVTHWTDHDAALVRRGA